METSFVQYEARVKGSLLAYALLSDFAAGAVGVALAFLVGEAWLSVVIVLVIATNALLFWLFFPRALQILDDSVRLATGGLGGARIGFDEIAEVRLEQGAVHLRGTRGQEIIRPTVLEEPEEFVARMSRALAHHRQRVAA